MAYAFFLGVDLDDREDDPAATLTLVEKEAEASDADATYHLRRIARVGIPTGDEDDEPYAGLVDHVQDLLADDPYTGRTIVVVNRNGRAGREALEALDGRGLTPLGVGVTGGEGATQQGSGMSLDGGDTAGRDEASLYVARRSLAGRLDRLQRTGRLEWALHDDAASQLARDLERYRADADRADATDEGEALGEAEQADRDLDAADADAAADDDAANEEAHDEEPTDESPTGVSYGTYVVSAGLAVWLGEERSFDPTEHLRGTPTTGEAKRELRPDIASNGGA